MSKSKRMIDGQLNLFDLLAQEETASVGKKGPDRFEAPKKYDRCEKPGILPKSFVECADCWCADCRHNAVNEGVPRELCGTTMPCPACESCIGEGAADICVIGSAGEGCRLRAEEEALLT